MTTSEPTSQPTSKPASRKTVTTADIALIATFAALVAVCSVATALPFGVNGVPVTLQMFAIFLCGAVLGARRGFLAVLLYLAVGAAGLPIFAGGASGLAPFAGSPVATSSRSRLLLSSSASWSSARIAATWP